MKFIRQNKNSLAQLYGRDGYQFDLESMFIGMDSIRVLCVGDVILDNTVECGAKFISQEAPVLVADHISSTYNLGGAANVAANLSGLGIKTTLVSVIGGDEEGQSVLGLLEGTGITRCVEFGEAPTTLKTRFVSRGQQLFRLDRDGILSRSDPVHRKLADGILSLDGRFNAIVLSDYGKGVVGSEVIQACGLLAQRLAIPLLVDPKGVDWSRYGRVDLIKPNAIELSTLTGMVIDDESSAEAALNKAHELCDAHAILVTRAADGASLAYQDGQATHFSAIPIEVSDVCGAGDTNIAAIAAVIAQGYGLPDAIRFAQVASAIAVQRKGTVAITRQDVVDFCNVSNSFERQKIESKNVVAKWAEEWRDRNLVIGFANGCFDVFHPGHAHILKMARKQCDKLVVGLNSDASVARLKGVGRPFYNENDRATILQCLEFVDAVAIFDEDDPLVLINAIMPDIIFKGSDYTKESVIGRDFVEGYGGRVEIIPLLEGHSTTKILTLARQ